MGRKESYQTNKNLFSGEDNPFILLLSEAYGRSAATGANGGSKNKKTHECKFCGKFFNGKFNLDLHVKTHTGEKDFICSICQKAFARKDTLKLHIWNKHTEKMDALSQ